MIYYTYPGFRNKALTISYDDGLWSDVHLLEICNRYGIRGPFNLNSGCMQEERRIGKDRIAELYKGHEVATHGVEHLTIARCPMTDVVKEILNDREALEELTGKIVCGHAYPNGSYSHEIKTLLPLASIMPEQQRTAENTRIRRISMNGILPVTITTDCSNMRKNFLPLICHSSSIFSMSGDTAMNLTGIRTGM